MVIRGPRGVDRLLDLLGVALVEQDAVPVELVVIGGAALNVLGLVVRPTKDVDVAALAESSGEIVIRKCRPLPDPVLRAAASVAQAVGLDPGWLNDGPADLLDAGLPKGFESRLTSKRYGTRLVVHFPDRFDLICLKVFAATDSGPGRHLADLQALAPTHTELLDAAKWTREQDPSESFCEMLCQVLRYMGADECAEELEHGDAA